MRRFAVLLVLGLVGCGAPERTADDFAADLGAAERVVAACNSGRETEECAAARRGLAEARRAARMRAYERAF